MIENKRKGDTLLRNPIDPYHSQILYHSFLEICFYSIVERHVHIWTKPETVNKGSVQVGLTLITIFLIGNMRLMCRGFRRNLNTLQQTYKNNNVVLIISYHSCWDSNKLGIIEYYNRNVQTIQHLNGQWYFFPHGRFKDDSEIIRHKFIKNEK